MERYISVDAGKFGTKVAEYLKEKDTVRVFQFRTKIGAGDFRDDAIENNTFIIGVKDKGLFELWLIKMLMIAKLKHIF